MTASFDAPTLRRFMRTVRVALATALAEHDIAERRGAGGAALFRALAAKSRDAWVFPAGGVVSRDGLLLAEVEHEEGAPRRLVLQAQGSAGLAAYAGRGVVVHLAGASHSGAFDRDGRMVLDLAGLRLGDEDLASFELRREDRTP